MNGLEHGIALADVSAACGADAALEFGCFGGYDVAVEIGENKYLKVGTALFVYELCGGYVDIPIVGCDFGIFLADFLAEIEKFSVGGFDDVGLGYDRYAVFVIFSGLFIGEPGNAVGALRGGDGKVYRQIVAHVNSL